MFATAATLASAEIGAAEKRELRCRGKWGDRLCRAGTPATINERRGAPIPIQMATIPLGEPRRSPIFKFRSRGYPESARSAGRSGAMIASTASASRDREHDIRDRLVHAPPYTEERGRPEGQLREVRDERERCQDR